MKTLIPYWQLQNRAVLLVLSLCFSLSIVAQPAGNRVVEETEVENLDGCSIVTVTFVAPVQYLSSFPASTGDELRVQFKPLLRAGEDLAAIRGHEVIRLMDKPVVDITRFEYVGEFYPDNPYLWLTFSNKVHFRVEQGEDFRSLTLYLAPESIHDCD